MSHIAQTGLTQTATLWVVSPNDSGGDVFAPPVSVKCRWEQRTEKFFSPLDRNEHVSEAIVYLDRDVEVGDYLIEGIFASLNPVSVAGAYKVQRYEKIPNLRNLMVIRKVYL